MKYNFKCYYTIVFLAIVNQIYSQKINFTNVITYKNNLTEEVKSVCYIANNSNYILNLWNDVNGNYVNVYDLATNNLHVFIIKENNKIDAQDLDSILLYNYSIKIDKKVKTNIYYDLIEEKIIGDTAYVKQIIYKNRKKTKIKTTINYKILKNQNLFYLFRFLFFHLHPFYDKLFLNGFVLSATYDEYKKNIKLESNDKVNLFLTIPEKLNYLY